MSAERVRFKDLRLPVIAAPMTMASSLDLILACCRAGVIGGFQAGNAGSPDTFAEWYDALEAARASALAKEERFAPFIVNLLASAARDPDAQRQRLEVCRFNRAPLILTTAGDPSAIVEQAHDWGGRVFHDVTTIRHVEKAVAAGVDGLMLVAAGSGGHSGALNPFAFVAQARRMFDGIIVLAGGIADGRGVAAALSLGADLVCMGTRFIATRESGANDAYRRMLVESGTDEVLYTDAIAGLPANFLRRSITENGLDADNLPKPRGRFRPDLPPGVRPWRTLWSAGHSVGMIDDAPSVGDVVDRLEREFAQHAVAPFWRPRLEDALVEPRAVAKAAIIAPRHNIGGGHA
jgi:nitronate monooxygenase